MIVEAVARLCGLFDALARGEAVSRHDLLAALVGVVSASFEFDSLAVAGEFPALDHADLAPGWRAHLGGAPLADAWACLRSHWLDHAVDALWVLHQVDPA